MKGKPQNVQGFASSDKGGGDKFPLNGGDRKFYWGNFFTG